MKMITVHGLNHIRGRNQRNTQIQLYDNTGEPHKCISSVSDKAQAQHIENKHLSPASLIKMD